MDTNKAPLPSELHAMLTITDEKIQGIDTMLASQSEQASLSNSELVDRMLRLTILQNRAKELEHLITLPAMTDAQKEAQQTNKIDLYFINKAIRKLSN